MRNLASAEASMAGMFSTSERPGKDIPRKSSNSDDETEARLWPSQWIPVPVPSVPISSDPVCYFILITNISSPTENAML